MSDVWRVRLRIGANGSDYENAGIIADDPYAAVAEAIGEILPSARVLQVARFIDIDAGWEPVYGPAGERPAEHITVEHGSNDLSGRLAMTVEKFRKRWGFDPVPVIEQADRDGDDGAGWAGEMAGWQAHEEGI